MKRLICFLLAAALLLPLFPACAEETQSEWTYEYSSRGQDIYRLGNTGYLVENWRAFMTPQYLNNVRWPIAKNRATNFNMQTGADQAANVEYLRGFMEKRMAFLDKQWGE